MSTPFILSETGSGRATAYIESSKIVTFHGKTHVAWLDTPPEGFRIKIRTRDHDTGAWSEAVTVGEAVDNHGGPALTIDREGYLHIVYFSHHHPFRYHRSVRPNDASEWGTMEQFGTDLTYPTLLCAADGTLILSARRSYEKEPWELELWRKPPGGVWTRQGPILKSQRVNYSQYAASMMWGADHKKLFLSFRIYEQPSYDTPPVSYTAVGFMMSPDEGRTWCKLNGTKLVLPATGDTVDIIFRSESAHGRVVESGAMALGPGDVPHIGYSVRLEHSSESYLATPQPGGGWHHLHLNPFLPHGWRNCAMIFSGGIVFNGEGQPIIVTPVVNLSDGQQFWGHKSTELVRLDSTDGGRTFTGQLVDEPDPSQPRWMPNLERPTGFNEVPQYPGMIYTDGDSGPGLSDMLQNKVVWQVLD